MRFCDLARPASLLLILGAGAAACNGASFTPASQIKSVRVLAVQKSPAYATPDNPVDVRLLYWDGRPDPTPLEVCFYDGCSNPPGDLYYNCFSQIAAQVATGATGARDCRTIMPESPMQGDAGSADDGAPPSDGSSDDAGASTPPDGGMPAADGGGPHPDPSHQVAHEIGQEKLPPSIVAVNPPSGPDYGLKYVLFTVCAGHTELRPPASPTDLPIQCIDDAGNVVSADGFVPGYSQLYIYDPSADRQNHNPIINGLSFGGGPIFNNFNDDPATVPTRPVCPTADCEVEVKVDVDRSSAEIDVGSTGLNGEQLMEGVWVDFYADKGDFTKPIRLINDATTGWNDDNATNFKVPAEAGTVHIWAVVHDNRGGVEWTEGKIVVK